MTLQAGDGRGQAIVGPGLAMPLSIHDGETHGVIQGRWVGWLATHHELNSFIIFCFQIQSQESKLSKFSCGMPHTPYHEHIESALHTMQPRPTLCQPSTLNSAAMTMLFERFIFKLMPATLLDLFLDQCLKLELEPKLNKA